MTYEEALKEYDEVLIPEVVAKFSNPKCGLFPMIREALEKQIPKKPIVDKEGYKYCPSCTKDFGICKVLQLVGNRERKMFDFCPNCGRAIDWGDEQ